MKFRYFKFLLGKRSAFFGSSVLKPIIPIQLSVGNSKIRYAALIDSGADFCIFDADIGESLELDIRSGIEINFGGIQEKGSATAYLHQLQISVGGHNYTTTAGFSFDIAAHGYGILGQKGFFDLFEVRFDLMKEIIELKPR